MCRMAAIFAMAALAAAIWCACARAEYLPAGGDDCAGVSDLLLIYSDDFSDAKWMKDNFLFYTYHLTQDAQPDGWFFDGFLFLAQTLPGGQATQIDIRSKPSDMGGWKWFLDRIFSKDAYIGGLEASVADAPRGLPDAGPRKVVIMIPYPPPQQRDFGDVDGDGKSEDLADPAARLSVVKWYVDSALDRWKASNYKHLRLAGFYWVDEGYRDADAEIIKETGKLVRDKGYRLFWIPYYMGDPNTARWRELGFDCAAKQPNYFFPNWKAERNRVATTAHRAEKQRMGVEIEVDDSVLTNPVEQYPKYVRYLNTGARTGFMKDSFVAYYQGVMTYMKLYSSHDARFRRLYDLTYDFVRGAYEEQAEEWK